MQRVAKLPLLFFFMAACVGLLLRWHSSSPLPWLVYPHWLHTHSHLMFLGWVLHALLLAMMVHFVQPDRQRWYKQAWLGLNVMAAGMLITFSWQGYGMYSILLSTLHSGAVVVWAFRFFKEIRGNQSEEVAFARMSLVFFLVSAIGPFVIGGLAAQGMNGSVWYHCAVYYYLHFQYNGVFTFGVIAVWLAQWQQQGIVFPAEKVRLVRLLLFWSCFPAYMLSTLWADPGLIFNYIGFLAAVVQLVALVLLVKLVWPARRALIAQCSAGARFLLLIAFLSLTVKFLLQAFSAVPAIAKLAYEIRPFVIAYLHLVLLGFLSFALLAWYHVRGWLALHKMVYWSAVAGFAGSELALVFFPFLNTSLFHGAIIASSVLLAVTAGAAWLSRPSKP